MGCGGVRAESGEQRRTAGIRRLRRFPQMSLSSVKLMSHGKDNDSNDGTAGITQRAKEQAEMRRRNEGGGQLLLASRLPTCVFVVRIKIGDGCFNVQFCLKSRY